MRRETTIVRPKEKVTGFVITGVGGSQTEKRAGRTGESEIVNYSVGSTIKNAELTLTLLSIGSWQQVMDVN